MQGQTEPLDWREGDVPVSRRFHDPYFSLDNGLEETRHVFLHGNGLPERFHDGLHIAELGFGTGLNFLTTLLEWRRSGVGGRFAYTSFEAFPMDAADMLRAQARFGELAELSMELAPAFRRGERRIEGPDFHLTLVIGDARDMVGQMAEPVDAWYLDGFSPAKNPELWEPALLRDVARTTRPGGTAATYSAAGHVRRALENAGFQTRRIKGFGRKRHMTTARRNG